MKMVAVTPVRSFCAGTQLKAIKQNAHRQVTAKVAYVALRFGVLADWYAECI
jgi:hypothetical protein